MAESRRSRDLAVLAAVVGAVVLLGVVAAVLYFQDRDSGGSEPTPPPTPTVRPATVHENLQDACEELVDEGIRGKRAKAPAQEDREEITETYLSDGGGHASVVGVGLTVCDRGWVIVIGVLERSAKVPSVGSNGTPVIAYLQGPYVAE